jgi:four helix bundle protein
MKKTPNAQRRTPIIEWHVNEEESAYVAKAETLNIQRPTLNDRGARRSTWKIRLLEFTVRLTKLVEALPTSRTGNHIAGQLLRCGTSPFANHGEVQAAESRKDFIHKLRICFKELKEVRRWLRFIARRELLPLKRIAALLTETEELIKIFSASIRTAEKNSK